MIIFIKLGKKDKTGLVDCEVLTWHPLKDDKTNTEMN